MKKMIAVAALMLISLAGKVYAQRKTLTPAERYFSTSYLWFNVRDFVNMPYGNITFELYKKSDYDHIKKIDSILVDLQRDIEFYRDSLDANQQDNIKIDYAVNVNGTKQLRFKRYSYGGSLFAINNRGTSRLKVEQDTIKIWLNVTEPDIEQEIKGRYAKAAAAEQGIVGNTKTLHPHHDVIITFSLNSYKDISKILADKDRLLQIIDTLQNTISQNASKGSYRHPRSAYYNVNSGVFKQYRGIAKTQYNIFHHTDLFTMNVSGGISAIRNTIAPMSEIVFSLQLSRDRTYSSYYHVFSLVAQPVFLFDKDAAGNHHIYDNWFINAEFGEEERDAKKDDFPNISMGVGYLAFKKGDYFKGNTFKVFLNLKKVNGILTYSPELIFTNDFKQIFPAFTMKVRI